MNKSLEEARAQIADNVAAELRRKRLNANTLPRHLGGSQSAWQRRIAGQLPFTIEELLQIAALLNVQITAFLQDVEYVLDSAADTDPLLITRRDCVSFLSRGIAPWSRLTYWSSIKQWVEYVRDFDIDPNCNLLKGIPKPRTPEPAARPINDEIVKRLLEVRSSHRAYAYIRLALFAGLRVHEIAQIRGEDFDHEAGWLMVTGKGGVTAPVPLHPEIVKLAGVMPEGGLWFPSRVDPTCSVNPMAVSATIVSALRSVGSEATAHQLRDTAATRIQRQVKDIRITQSMMRHRSIRSTQKYCGVSDESMRSAVGALDWRSAA